MAHDSGQRRSQDLLVLSISMSTSCSCNCSLRRKLTSSWCESCLALQLSTCEPVTVARGLFIGPPESLTHPRVRVWGDTCWRAPPGPHKGTKGLHQGASLLPHPKEQPMSTMGSNHLLPQKVSQFVGTMAQVCFVRAKRNFAGRL